MARILQEANSIAPWLQFTSVSSADNVTRTVPMLDMQMSVQHTQQGELVRYSFYEKASTSGKVLMYESAMSVNTKVTTLANEIVRRQRNTDRLWGPEHRAAITTKFMVKLRDSGYPEKVRLRILHAGIQGYYRMVVDERRGRRQINRPREMERDQERREWKLAAPS